MKWLRFTAVAFAGAFVLVIGAYSALLWGMPYDAGRFHHAVAYLGLAILIPSDVLHLQNFGDGDLLALGCLYGALILMAQLWLDRRRSKLLKVDNR